MESQSAFGMINGVMSVYLKEPSQDYSHYHYRKTSLSVKWENGKKDVGPATHMEEKPV